MRSSENPASMTEIICARLDQIRPVNALPQPRKYQHIEQTNQFGNPLGSWETELINSGIKNKEIQSWSNISI